MPSRRPAVGVVACTGLLLACLVGAAGPAGAAGCPALDPPAGPAGLRGDLNGDRHADAVIGEPGWSAGAGRVRILYGTADGPTADKSGSAPGDQLLSRATAGIAGPSAAGDEFGAVVAVADFDRDGCSDVAVGAPGDSEGAGSVTVLYGSPAGLTATGSGRITQGPRGVPERAEPGDRFGAALAAGDLDGDGYDDLAVGAPGERVGHAGTGEGEVWVLHGGADGLGSGDPPRRLNQETAGVPGTPEFGDRFGAALAVGDFDLGGAADLAVGAPGENDAGSVTVFPGPGPGGVGPDGPVRAFGQDTAGVPGVNQPGDRFGAALAAGDVNGDGADELAVGVPGQDDDTGAVVVLYGSENELNGDEHPAQLLSQVPEGVFGLADARDEFGAALAFGRFGDGPFAGLAVGVPGDRIGTGGPRAGGVNVFYSRLGRLSFSGDQRLHADVVGIDGRAEAGDRFGASLCALPIQVRGRDSLLIGVPGEDVGAVADAGEVAFVPLTLRGLNPITSRSYSAATDGVRGEPAASGRLGRSLG